MNMKILSKSENTYTIPVLYMDARVPFKEAGNIEPIRLGLCPPKY